MKVCLGRLLQECREATGPTVETRHDFGLCARGMRLLAPPGSHWPVEKQEMGEDGRRLYIREMPGWPTVIMLHHIALYWM